MASESRKDGLVIVSLPPELDAWLDQQAAELDLSRDDVLVHLLSSYQATAEADADLDASSVPVDPEALREALEPTVSDHVETRLEEHLDDRLDTLLEERVDERIEERLDERLEERVTALLDTRIEERVEAAVSEAVATGTDSQADLAAELEQLRSDFDEKIQDVRDRVVQVKKEADGKASANHDHEELGRIDDLARRLDDLQVTVEELDAAVEDATETMAEREGSLESVRSDVADLEDRVTTVAWVVTDLREVVETDSETASLKQLKHTAAENDISRAKCENCGEGVELSLLTEPECPHCQTAVTDVEPSTGFFRKPTLLVASQLESGEKP